VNLDEGCLDVRTPDAPQNVCMITRIWHGRTSRHKADAYAAFLATRAIPDYRSVPGNISAHVLRRDETEVTHFLTVTFWESEDAIRGFAGDELLTARYYDEDRDFLLEFEPQVQHFQVSATAPQRAAPLKA
jgi:heme-degrading monooxygenase HmoA